MTEIQIIFDVLLKISSLAEKKIMLMIKKNCQRKCMIILVFCYLKTAWTMSYNSISVFTTIYKLPFQFHLMKQSVYSAVLIYSVTF